MNKILHVAMREFRETIKTRTFIFGLIFTPLMIIAMIFVVEKTNKNAMLGAQPLRSVAVVDCTNRLDTELNAAFARYNQSNPTRPIKMIGYTSAAHPLLDTIKQDVRDGRLNACVEIPTGIETASAGQPVQYFAKINISDFDLFTNVKSIINEVVVNRRYAQHHLSPDLIAQLSKPVPIETVDLQEKKEGRGKPSEARMMLPFFFMFLMFMGIFTTNQGLLLSVIEEKNSRVIEVLLAAVSPFQLMAGKIAGLIGVGFTLIAVWGAVGVGAAQYFHVAGMIASPLLGWFIVYFVSGFILTASLYAAIGSACNTIKEAQNLLMPISIVMMLPWLFWMPISQNPMGTLAKALTLFPPTTPMIMMLRLAAQPDLPLDQIIISLVVMVAGMAATFWAAGKIFRVGILMYGKPPTPGEILKWLRYR